MKKKILIDAHFPTEIRVALVDKNNLVESFECKSNNKSQTKSNIYLAKVTRVEPSLQAAFVDYGDDKSGFLPFDEIHQDYFHLPSHLLNSNEKSNLDKNLSIVKSIKADKKHFDDRPKKLISNEINDGDEIDLERIKQLVEDKVEADFEIDAYEDEIEKIDEKDTDPESTGSKIDRTQYRIQEVIKKGQILLVQITKESRGNKGASLTTYISLAGKYSVLMPNTADNNGISRKISNFDERKRLKGIIADLSEVNNHKASIIVRTAGAGQNSSDIKRDFEYLTKLWNQIRELTLKSTAPSFIHSEDSIILKTVRDLFDKNVKEILIQGPESFKECMGFVKDMMPQQISSVKEYKGNVPLFTKYGIEDQLIKLYQTNVQLPSGGYIVINPTEALISIDVNSGKSTSEKNIEETALKTNLEAAREIARQAKLRDLAGLLVLDFIDMSDANNRKIVERALKEFLSKDKARIQTSPISSFGLLEMSRQRLRPSFLEVNSKMCTHCGGKGLVRNEESNAMLILRTIENEIHNASCDIVNVYGISPSILYLLNNKRSEISFIENKYGIKLNFYIDTCATSDSYSIETVKSSNQKLEENIKKTPLIQTNSISYVDQEVASSSARKKIATKRVGQYNNQQADLSDDIKTQGTQERLDGSQNTDSKLDETSNVAQHRNSNQKEQLKNKGSTTNSQNARNKKLHKHKALQKTLQTEILLEDKTGTDNLSVKITTPETQGLTQNPENADTKNATARRNVIFDESNALEKSEQNPTEFVDSHTTNQSTNNNKIYENSLDDASSKRVNKKSLSHKQRTNGLSKKVATGQNPNIPLQNLTRDEQSQEDLSTETPRFNILLAQGPSSSTALEDSGTQGPPALDIHNKDTPKLHSGSSGKHRQRMSGRARMGAVKVEAANITTSQEIQGQTTNPAQQQFSSEIVLSKQSNEIPEDLDSKSSFGSGQGASISINSNREEPAISNNNIISSLDITDTSSILHVSLIASELIAQGVIFDQLTHDPIQNFRSNEQIHGTQNAQAINNEKLHPQERNFSQIQKLAKPNRKLIRNRKRGQSNQRNQRPDLKESETE